MTYLINLKQDITIHITDGQKVTTSSFYGTTTSKMSESDHPDRFVVWTVAGVFSPSDNYNVVVSIRAKLVTSIQLLENE